MAMAGMEGWKLRKKKARLVVSLGPGKAAAASCSVYLNTATNRIRAYCKTGKLLTKKQMAQAAQATVKQVEQAKAAAPEVLRFQRRLSKARARSAAAAAREATREAAARARALATPQGRLKARLLAARSAPRAGRFKEAGLRGVRRRRRRRR